jgi:hypothetical protein
MLMYVAQFVWLKNRGRKYYLLIYRERKIKGRRRDREWMCLMAWACVEWWVIYDWRWSSLQMQRCMDPVIW